MEKQAFTTLSEGDSAKLHAQPQAEAAKVHAPPQTDVAKTPAQPQTARRAWTRLADRHLAAGLAALALVLLLASLAIAQLTTPALVPASAPATTFSAERAMQHIQVIGRQPHPIGSAENAQVRQYLVQELTRLGIPAQVQDGYSFNNWGLVAQNRHVTYIPSGIVHNVVARLEGTDNAKAVLLMAHYDSVPVGPGATDNGSAVSALLETARALQAGPPLKNDIIFLFTDGEEFGLLGARAFVNEHPWAKDVGLAFNFEARGTSGPVLLFETSADSGPLIKEFVQAAPHPFASSLFFEVYKLLPNSTDFTTFRDAGFAGLNFALLDGFTGYHSEIDSIENVDLGSLQHHGSYALALARHFGNMSLENQRGSDLVYFNAFGTYILTYPTGLALPIGIAVAILFGAIVLLGLRRKRLTLLGTLLGWLVFPLVLIGNAAFIMLAWRIIQSLYSGYDAIRQGDTYNSHFYMIGFVALAIALTTLLYTWLHTRMRVENLAVGALGWWMILTIVTSVYMPGASYVFVWPLLFSTIGLGIAFAPKERDFSSIKTTGILLLSSIPGILIISPLVYLLFVSLTLRLAAAAIVVVVLLLGLFIPYFAFMKARNRWLLPGLAALVGIACIVAGGLTSGFDQAHPRQNSLLYGLNADTGEATWATGDRHQDEWTTQFVSGDAERSRWPEFYPWLTTEFMKGPAPILPLAAPDLTLIDDTTSGDLRTLRMHISSPRQAPMINVYVLSDSGVFRVVVDGKRVYEQPSNTGSGSPLILSHWSLPKAGMELELTVPASQPLELRLVDQSYTLAALPGLSLPKRTNAMIMVPFGFETTDSVLVSKSFAFGKQP